MSSSSTRRRRSGSQVGEEPGSSSSSPRRHRRRRARPRRPPRRWAHRRRHRRCSGFELADPVLLADASKSRQPCHGSTFPPPRTICNARGGARRLHQVVGARARCRRSGRRPGSNAGRRQLPSTTMVRSASRLCGGRRPSGPDVLAVTEVGRGRPSARRTSGCMSRDCCSAAAACTDAGPGLDRRSRPRSGSRRCRLEFVPAEIGVLPVQLAVDEAGGGQAAGHGDRHGSRQHAAGASPYAPCGTASRRGVRRPRHHRGHTERHQQLDGSHVVTDALLGLTTRIRPVPQVEGEEASLTTRIGRTPRAGRWPAAAAQSSIPCPRGSPRRRSRTGSSASQPENGDASVTTNKATPISPRPATATRMLRHVAEAAGEAARTRRAGRRRRTPTCGEGGEEALSGQAVERAHDDARLAAVARASTATRPRPVGAHVATAQHARVAATTIDASSASGMTR